MAYYPIFLDLDGKPVLVVGAGKVALRKTKGLLEAGAAVTVIAPRIRPEFANLPVTLVRRPFRPADLRGRGIPVNVADSRRECTFIVPARITRRNIQIAISTGGESPRVAAALRRKIEENL